MSYTSELDQIKAIIENGMTTYGDDCEFVTEVDTEMPSGGYDSEEEEDNIIVLIKVMPWGADHNASEYWRVFEIIMEDIVNEGLGSTGLETFEKAAAELQNIEYTYEGGGADVPYAVSVTPLVISRLPNNVRSFRVMAFWSK